MHYDRIEISNINNNNKNQLKKKVKRKTESISEEKKIMKIKWPNRCDDELTQKPTTI